MFVRWRLRPTGRLSARLVEHRRVDGRVRQEHVAELSAIDDAALLVPGEVLGIGARRAFWRTANAALARLANRIDAETEGMIRGALHARVSIVTPDELQRLALANAEHDAEFWRHQAEQGRQIVTAREGLIATAQSALVDDKAIVAADEERAAEAEKRIARARTGEAVDPDRSLTKQEIRDMLARSGVTPWQARRYRQLATEFEGLNEDQFRDEIRARVERRYAGRPRKR